MKTRFAQKSLTAIILFVLLTASRLRADQVEMKNGDRYVGLVVSLNSDALILQSENLGKVLLPRSGVAVITLGQAAPVAALSTPATVNTNTDLAAAFSQLGSATNLIPQIRDKYLAGAGPEANNKFNEMMGGLMSGQVDMNGLRAQVQSAVGQLKSLQKEGAADADPSMSMYLGILEKFLKESAPATNPPTGK